MSGASGEQRKMADYYPLLAKTFDGLSDTGPAMRETVYDRARRALSIQLRQLDPPLSQADLDREGAALERAIRQIESRYPAQPAGLKAERRATTPRPPSPAPPTAPAAVEPPPLAPAAADETPPPAQGQGPDRQGDDAAAVAIRRGGRKPSLALPIGFVLLAIPVGVVAWLWRDRPAPTVAEPTPAPATSAPVPDTKYGERVGAGGQKGAAAPPAAAPAGSPNSASRPAASPPAASAPATPARPADRAAAAPVTAPAAAPASSDVALAVAQRAMLFEENPSTPQQPKITAGRAIWRLDALNGGQGLPLDTVVLGRVDVPNAGMTLSLTLRRNLDPALPASHTIELTFTTQPGDPGRVVRDVGLPQMRAEETIRGIALAGLPVPVKENVFLIGLSDLKSDVDKNTELLVNRGWVELQVRLASGQKAVLLFEKGVSGDRVLADAFRQWSQP